MGRRRKQHTTPHLERELRRAERERDVLQRHDTWLRRLPTELMDVTHWAGIWGNSARPTCTQSVSALSTSRSCFASFCPESTLRRYLGGGQLLVSCEGTRSVGATLARHTSRRYLGGAARRGFNTSLSSAGGHWAEAGEKTTNEQPKKTAPVWRRDDDDARDQPPQKTAPARRRDDDDARLLREALDERRAPPQQRRQPLELEREARRERPRRGREHVTQRGRALDDAVRERARGRLVVAA